MMRCWQIALLAFLAAPAAGACPCVETEIVAVHEDQWRLVATISETSEVMVTAALWDMLLTTIHRDYPDWRGRWRVSFFTDAAAALGGGAATPDSHVADYDGETMRLTLWPQLEARRRELFVAVK